jgi:DNA-directed RNA polymerase subunit M/transcription elongation factor TFIIS
LVLARDEFLVLHFGRWLVQTFLQLGFYISIFQLQLSGQGKSLDQACKDQKAKMDAHRTVTTKRIQSIGKRLAPALVEQIEAEVYKNWPSTHEYDQAIRKLLTALPSLDNDDIIERGITVQDLIKLGPKQLAERRQQQLATRIQQTQREVQARMDESGIECDVCHKLTVHPEQKQLRGADEPMTLFWKCSNCGKSERAEDGR